MTLYNGFEFKRMNKCKMVKTVSGISALLVFDVTMIIIPSLCQALLWGYQGESDLSLVLRKFIMMCIKTFAQITTTI